MYFHPLFDFLGTIGKFAIPAALLNLGIYFFLFKKIEYSFSKAFFAFSIPITSIILTFAGLMTLFAVIGLVLNLKGSDGYFEMMVGFVLGPIIFFSLLIYQTKLAFAFSTGKAIILSLVETVATAALMWFIG